MSLFQLLFGIGLILSLICGLLLYISSRYKGGSLSNSDLVGEDGEAEALPKAKPKPSAVDEIDAWARKLEQKKLVPEKALDQYLDIAEDYVEEQQYSKAIYWYEKVLLLQDADPHEAVNTCLAIASVCQQMDDTQAAQNWINEAQARLQQFLAQHMQELGATHPATLAVRNQQARLYAEQGKFLDAVEAYRKVLNEAEQLLGNEHPLTQSTYREIAVVQQKKQDYKLALKWYEKLLTIQDEVLGPTHPETIATCIAIADVYKAAESDKEEQQWLQQLVAQRGQSELLAPEIYQRLAENCAANEQTDAARDWYITAQKAFEQTLKVDPKAARHCNLDICGYIGQVIAISLDKGAAAYKKSNFKDALKENIIAYSFMLDYEGGKAAAAVKLRHQLEIIYHEAGLKEDFEVWLAEAIKKL